MQEVNIEGTDYMVDLIYIPDEHWYIGAVIDKSIAFQTVSKLRSNSLIYIISGVIVGLILLTFLIKKFMHPLDTLNLAIRDIASGEGDLTRRLDTNSDQEFAELAIGFNQFTESLHGKICDCKNISRDIRTGINQVMESATESADFMHSQMQEVDQLATAMNEMAASASEVANNAQQAAVAAREADDVAGGGAGVVGLTTTSIFRLSEHIEQAAEDVKNLEMATANIEMVLEVINNIAEQTNLLALNAAIEVPELVVPGGVCCSTDEVRTLAQRTQDSTTEIRTMIEKLQSGTVSVSAAMKESQIAAAEAVDKSQAANESLQKIQMAVQQINDMNIQIASAAEEQSLVLKKLMAI